MSRSRTWIAGTVVAALLILVAGWFLLISPAKSSVAEVQTEYEAQEATNQQLQNKLDQLKAAQADLPAQEARLAEIRAQLPESPYLPSLVRQVDKLAVESGVHLVTIAQNGVVDVAVAAAVTTPPASQTVGGTETPAGEASTPKASDAANQAEAADAAGAGEGAATTEGATPAAPQAAAVVLKAIPLTIQVSGNYFNVVRFLNKLEEMQRSMLVYGVTIAPNPAAKDSKPDMPTLVTDIQSRVYYVPPALTVDSVTDSTGTGSTTTGTQPAAN